MFDRQSGSTYPGYFGLREQPFNLAPDPRFFYRNASAAEAHAELLAAIRERKGIVVLNGVKGIGKTTLLRKVMEDLADSARCYYFAEPELTVADLREFGRGVLGLKPDEVSDGPPLAALDRYFRTPARDGRTPVLLIDEAHGATAEAIEAIDRLVGSDDDGESGLQVVLAGLPELAARLLATNSWRLKQGAIRQIRLRPFATNEVGAYLDHRLRVAGNQAADLFTAEAARMIAADAGGIPRRINLLADKALTAAEQTERTQISPALLTTIFHDQSMVEAAAPSPKSKAPRAGTRPDLRAENRDHAGRGAARRPTAGVVIDRPVPARRGRAWALGSGAILVLVAMVALAIGQAGGDRTTGVEANARVAELSIALRAAKDRARQLDNLLVARTKERDGLVSRLAQSTTENGRLRRGLGNAERRRRAAADVAAHAVDLAGATRAAVPPARAKVTRARSRHLRRLADLMRRAEAHVAARRLTTPAEGNALASYRRVLELAPGNRPALDGIAALKMQYLSWATAAERKRQWISSLSYYEKAFAIDPGDDDLAAKLRRIKHRGRRAAGLPARRGGAPS